MVTFARIQESIGQGGAVIIEAEPIEGIRESILGVLDVAIPVFEAGVTAVEVERETRPFRPFIPLLVVGLFILGFFLATRR